MRSVFYRMYQDQAVIQLKWSNVRLAVDSLRETRDRDNLDDFFRRINNDRMRGGRVNQNNMIGNDRIPQKQGIIVIVSDSSISHCLVEFLKKKKLLNAIVQLWRYFRVKILKSSVWLFLKLNASSTYFHKFKSNKMAILNFNKLTGANPKKITKLTRWWSWMKPKYNQMRSRWRNMGRKRRNFFNFAAGNQIWIKKWRQRLVRWEKNNKR